MKRILAIALVGMAGMFTVGASAQTARVKAIVPFDFTVNGHMLPASTYIVSSPHHGLIAIESADHHSSAFSVTFDTGKRPVDNGKLVFAKYGNQYFLRQVLCPAVSIDAELPTSSLEKKVRRQQLNSIQGEMTVVTKAETTLVATK